MKNTAIYYFWSNFPFEKQCNKTVYWNVYLTDQIQ